MKSRTSSYKGTWLRKNLTRFMPFWAIYTLCLLLGLAMMANGRDDFYYVMNLAECARIMAAVNCGYALLTAQLLFGDLYSSRMCFGIHALPLRREEIFSLNVLSGLLFSLVPTALMTLIALPMAMGSSVIRGGLIPLLWFAGANLQYLFFFSLAVFCAFCAGSRLSMALLYGILNFISLLAYLLTESLYMPLLPGVKNPFGWFQMLCPVGKISVDPLILLERMEQSMPGTYEIQADSWLYLLTCAALGVFLLLIALQMYRKRALETAGEFIAVKALRPVFLLLFALSGAMSLNLAANMFFGFREKTFLLLLFAAAGLIAGWFIGLMLLEKTSRVFRKQTFLGLGTLLAVVAASMLLTHLDIFHVVSWVPEASQVESVYVIPGYDSYGEYWTGRDNYQISDPEALEMVQMLHTQAIEEKLGPEDAVWYYSEVSDVPEQALRYTVPVSLEYHLLDGAVRRRTYFIYADGAAGEMAEKLFSREAMVMRNYELLESQAPVSGIMVNGYEVPEESLTPEDIQALLSALRRDCREGHLAQMQEFHPVPVWADEEMEISCLYLNVGFSMGTWQDDLYLDVYSDSTHTLNWLRQRGILDAVLKEAGSYR